MQWWQALILGIVEGLTEYLPVSSTGHLLLVNRWLGLNDSADSKTAAFTYAIVIQSGAILAVVGLYRQRIGQMTLGLLGRPQHKPGLKLAINLIIAFLPAMVLGPILAKHIRAHLTGPWPVAGALFVGGWLMLAVAYSRKIARNEHKGFHLDQLTWKIALFIGFGQCVAMWPGTSRSMMTIATALLLGLRPRAAAEFSFLLGLITLSAATVYESYQHGSQMLTQYGWEPLAIGFVASAISAGLAVKWFVGFLTRRGLAPFGWYRLVLAVLIVAILLFSGNATPGSTPTPAPESSPAPRSTPGLQENKQNQVPKETRLDSLESDAASSIRLVG